jgi:hypothetical protein
MVDDAVVDTSQRGDVSLKVAFSVLAGTDHAQVGKRITEYFQVDGKAVDKLYNLAEAVGLLTAEQRRAAAEAGVGLEVDETLMKGRTCCGEIKMEPNMRQNPATGAREIDPEKPGPFPKIGFRTFAVGSKKAEGIPLDKRFLGGQQPPNAPPVNAPQAPQKPAGGATMDKW